jgi:hypothetical protein
VWIPSVGGKGFAAITVISVHVASPARLTQQQLHATCGCGLPERIMAVSLCHNQAAAASLQRNQAPFCSVMAALWVIDCACSGLS